MLEGIERLTSLMETQTCALTGANSADIAAAVQQGDVTRLAQTAGHFAAVQRDGQTVRMARTIGIPLRYLVTKLYHGPYLIVGQRIDQLYDWCQRERIGWQFDPAYTRMVPAHYLVELDQIGCPDPAPRYRRFFHPALGTGSADLREVGTRYIGATLQALKDWLLTLPAEAPLALAFSGGVDSTAVLLLALQALRELNANPNRLRAFTLDLGAGRDAQQAATVIAQLGLQQQWERVELPASALDLAEAIRVIEDYHPLDVECAAMSLLLLGEIRTRYPELKYLLDGDGGDENLKAYPLEDSDLTISSVLRNPLLYQEGWGVDALKHSQTYSGGLSRGYVRTYAPAHAHGFTPFSPFTVRSVMAEALALPFEQVIGESAARLATVKQDVVSVGIQMITGITMPVHPKRRFQEGAGGTTAYHDWRVSKAWCRQTFLNQWEERLRTAWRLDEERRSGNEMTIIPITEGTLMV